MIDDRRVVLHERRDALHEAIVARGGTILASEQRALSAIAEELDQIDAHDTLVDLDRLRAEHDRRRNDDP